MPLSAAIITFNEARNLPRCLASLEGVADEIVVLDSFSTDTTEQIARAAGARFEQHAFDGHIQQKNRAIGLCTHDFVLSLDADEALDDLVAAIGTAIAADRTLGSLCDWIEASAPQPVDLPVEGAATMKAAIVPITLTYSTADPLG